MGISRIFSRAAILAVLFAFVALTPSLAHAATNSSCTNGGGDWALQANTTIISDIARNVTTILNSLSSQMYSNVVGSSGGSGLNKVITTLLTIYIIIYGILFMFGAVQISVFDFIKRLANLAIVAMLLKGSGGFLYSVLYDLFEVGTEEILNVITKAMFGGLVPQGNDAGPLSSLDSLVSAVVSPKTAAVIQAIWGTGYYGIFIFLIIGSSLFSILEAVLNAMWVYLMSKVVRTLLLGVAPIFIACVLFEQTRSYFLGWLNQLISACLQPIFLFAFFSFFSTILADVVNKIVNDAPVCKTRIPDTARGASSDIYGMRFQAPDSDGKLAEYKGMWGVQGPAKSSGNSNPAPFPIDIFTILVFFILAELASRFNGIAIALANGITGITMDMSMAPGTFAKPPTPATPAAAGAQSPAATRTAPK